MKHSLLQPLVAALVCAAPALAAPGTGLAPVSAEPATPAVTDDVPPKDDEKKNEVTVWVLDASGKG